MKAPLILIGVLFLAAASGFATQHVVTNSGNSFVPATLNANVGDTVVFSIAGIHNAVQVAESDWNSEIDNPLGGGFAVGFGGGSIVLADTGTKFYICQAHIAGGMKGKIIVGPPPPPTSTITITSVADRDGSVGTTGDRVAKNWALTLYQDSLGGTIVGSVASGSTLTVPGLAPGTYVAAEADTSRWSHLSMTVDNVSQGVTSAPTWTFTIGAPEAHSIVFINTVPNMVISSGNAFDPDTITVATGDTVHWVLAAGHEAREVSKATWLANGTTSNGGFDLPSPGGWWIASPGGVHYYRCVQHAGSISRGIVMVTPIPPSTITVSSAADQDGSVGTTGDRIAKPWSLKLYQDSVGSGIVVDSVNSGGQLVVTGLAPGVYVAAEADSAGWSHLSLTIDGVSQGVSALTTASFSVGSSESRTVEFFNTAPNMIISSGFAFSPDTMDVDSGETVHFVLDPMHNARQVDSVAWAANDTLPNGGFDLPMGGGSALMDEAGTAFYVCVPHAAGGMKGIVRVHVEPSSGSLTDSVADGWNLLSMPYAATDTPAASLYPTAVSPAYAYASGYTTMPLISNGPGYWIKFGPDEEITVSGLLVAVDTIPVQPGWNIVGAISAPVAVAEITSNPPAIQTSSFYGYDNGYFTADSLHPGLGYWVKVSTAGSLFVGPASAVPAAGRIVVVPGGELPPEPPGAGEPVANVPAGFSLGQNYPNPFNPATRIPFSLDRESRVRVSVHNILGELVATIVDGAMPAGPHVVEFDGSSLPAGVYVVRLSAAGRDATINVSLIK